MSKHVIGDKVRAKEKSWYRNRVVITAFCPQIQVDGRFVFLQDKTTASGIMECDTREEAREKAREVRDKARSGGEGADTE